MLTTNARYEFFNKKYFINRILDYGKSYTIIVVSYRVLVGLPEVWEC